MKTVCFLAVCLLAAAGDAAEPIGLHPQNPHYFLFRGKPAETIRLKPRPASKTWRWPSVAWVKQAGSSRQFAAENP